MAPEESAGDLAIVLHSHMPYVEGFGTYPFGEEWLFDAVIRSYLPVLEVAERLTMTITPVLADQLEDAGVKERLRRFLTDWRIAAAAADVDEVDAECRDACVAEHARYSHALELLDADGGDPLRAFQRAAAEGRDRPRRLGGDARRAAAARHPPGPAPAARDRHPLAPAALRLGGRLLAARVRLRAGPRVAPGGGGRASGSASTRAATGSRSTRWRRSPPRPARWRCRSTGRRSSGSGRSSGYPSDPAHAQFAGESLRGVRIWKVGGGGYDPAAAAAVARRQAGEFLAAVAARLREYSASRRRRGLLVFAIDTELLGHWWSEGAIWLREVLAGADDGRGAPAHRARGAGRARAGRAAAPRLDLGRGEGPAHLGLAGRRRPRLGRAAARAARAAGALARACAATRAKRAARELLAAQASDWAFLDQRGQAGDYAYQRAISHSEAALEAIDSPAIADPRMRALAPDLSLSPLLQP